MTFTSEKTNRRCTRLTAVVALLAVVTIGSSGSALAGLSGAIFTTRSGCVVVNGNIYDTKDDVYLDGGPHHGSSASLPDGSYFVQVTDPSGANVLGQSQTAVVTVSGGAFVDCYQLSSIVYSASSSFASLGYDDTPNNGGEYKVWVCVDGNYVHDTTKTDNFKVRKSVFCVGDGCPLAISCPLDVNAECEGKNGAHVTYEAPIVIGGTGPYTVTCTPESGSLFPSGPTLVTCTATDSSDPQQTDSCQFTVTVPDSCPGTCVFACGPDVPGGCGNSLVGGICGRTVTYFLPECPGSTIDCKPASGTFFAVASTTVTCTATDPTDGTQTCTFKVTVTNPGAPVLTGCPSDTTFQCYGDVPAAATVTAANACGDTVPVVPGESQTKQGSSCNNVITRTWTATDACGNTASCTQKITVNDNTRPTINNNAGANATIYCPATPVFTPPTASDNCGSVTVCAISTNTVAGSCGSYTRTVTWQAKDACGNLSVDTRSQTIKVECSACGGLTMGFWQNKNGQAIITGQAQTGVCPLATWLRLYAPFQDLGATATCSSNATYVYNCIKAANASGAAMNAMLKAQMLATALDVYFSDPALGGNKIGAPAPIGGDSIDLTHICKMIDGSGGTATCSATYQNASAAFGGATCLTVSQLLAYASSQSNAGGGAWYGQVKTTQELAKNTFDAINNRVAFSGCTP